MTGKRVTQADIEANIADEFFFTAAEAIAGHGIQLSMIDPRHPLALLTLCVLVLRNGFTVTGESACADPAIFNAEIGRGIARANALQKVWPLMGYELRTKLAIPLEQT